MRGAQNAFINLEELSEEDLVRIKEPYAKMAELARERSGMTSLSERPPRSSDLRGVSVHFRASDLKEQIGELLKYVFCANVRLCHWRAGECDPTASVLKVVVQGAGKSALAFLHDKHHKSVSPVHRNRWRR
jgi:hypothetical protein